MKNKVILALDLDDIKELRVLLKNIGDSLKTLKVGKRLFTKYGPDLIKELKDKDYNVFLDLKFHDIPNTVKLACYEAAKHGVSMLTIHCSGGKDMCKEAVLGAMQGAEESNNNIPIILGVTVLTSLDDASLKELGVNIPLMEYAELLANLALNSGVHGIVCSPFEVKKLKKSINKVFVAVTPGIRLPENKSDDQKRIADPRWALEQGSDYLVVGRPIYGSKDPKKTINEIYELMRGKK